MNHLHKYLIFLTLVIGIFYFQKLISRAPRTQIPSVILQNQNRASSLFALQTSSCKQISKQEYPSPLDHLSEAESKHFPGGYVIESADIQEENSARSIRIRILKTNFKYPYLRIVSLQKPLSIGYSCQHSLLSLRCQTLSKKVAL